MAEFRMPSLGADMEFGTVTRWLIKPGDEVHRGDVVAVVDTEKSTIEVEIFQSGVVDALLVSEGEEVAVGIPLARIAVPAEVAPVPQLVPAPVERPEPAPVVMSPVVRHLADTLGVELGQVAGTGPGGRVTRADVEHATPPPSRRGRKERAKPAKRARSTPPRRVPSSPRARQLALELGIDLGSLLGSGPGGAVLEKDVMAAASTKVPPREPPAETESERQPVDRQAAMRRAIGALMARSKREIPHYYLSTTIDMSPATTWLEQANLERSVASRLVAPVLMLKAVARAASAVPEMNGFFVDGAFVPSTAIHVGVAISIRGGGVIAPAIHDVDQLALGDLMERLKDLVGRARTGALRSSEMSDPTITVSNLGDLGVESVFGVIYPPQVALVGFGRVTERPWAEDGMLAVRPCVTATLSADHRASDGHRGAHFLAEIDKALQKPEEL